MYKKEIIPYLHMNCSLLSSPPIYIHLCFSPLPRIHTHTCPRVASKDRALMYSTHAYHHLPAGSALCSSHAQDGSRPREIISRRRRHSRLDLLPPPPPPLFYTIYPPLSWEAWFVRFFSLVWDRARSEIARIFGNFEEGEIWSLRLDCVRGEGWGE